jgi:SAM-dependent methyltransferase
VQKPRYEHAGLKTNPVASVSGALPGAFTAANDVRGVLMVKQFVQRRVYQLSRMMTLGLRCGPHLSRYAMYARLVQHQTKAVRGRALSISGSQSLCRLLGFVDGQIDDASYPAANILALPYPDDTFDLVASDQVLEHIEGDPQRAVDECFRVLKPGGLAVHTTCLLQPIHAAPGDYWRFTPDGLAFLSRGRADVIEADGWGNVVFQLAAALGMRMLPVPHARWHPWHWIATHNMKNWPVVTWVVARKHDASAPSRG